MNLMILRVNFYLLIFILGFFISKNVSGFKCELKRDFYGEHCYVQPDSFNNTGQINYEDKDISWVKLYTNSFKIKNLTISEFPICDRFENLKKLEIFGNSEKYLDENFLYHCEQITYFKLLRINLKEIGENCFIKNQKLETIILEKLSIVTLPENLFLNQNKLENLYLWHNKIAFLPSNIFKSLTKLKNLYLSYNSLKTLNPAWFKTFENLYELSLSGNEIKDLPKNIFQQLKDLEALYLGNNQPTVIHSDSFGIHLKLKYISLRWNKIIEIEEKLIDNSIVSQIDMDSGNICFNENIEKIEEIKPKLQKCFSNYRPRHDQLSLPWNFTHLTSEDSCGIRKIPRPSIHGSSNIVSGEFPWNAVLRQYLGSHFCGGTLISKKAVVTAAHCIKGKNDEPNFSPSDFSILLGAHDLSLASEPTRVTVWAKAIHIHPDWNANIENYEANVAVLEIENDFEFSNFIQPVCLPNQESQSGVVNAEEGVVAGFGLLESGDLAKIAQKVVVPIIDFRICIRNSPDHRSFISARAFCGGPGDGRGVCSGDSGAGLYTYYNGKYFLQGVVSTALMSNEFGCNVDSYGIYTNVVDFYGWIMTGKTY